MCRGDHIVYSSDIILSVFFFKSLLTNKNILYQSTTTLIEMKEYKHSIFIEHINNIIAMLMYKQKIEINEMN